MAVSCGGPSSCGVECTGEQPPTVVSESNCRSSKVRGSSLSIIDPHSRDRRHPRGSTASSVSPSSSTTPLDGSLGSTSPCPSAISCSSPCHSPSSCSICSLSSSSEEESSGQPMRWQAPSSAMRSASWGLRGT